MNSKTLIIAAILVGLTSGCATTVTDDIRLSLEEKRACTQKAAEIANRFAPAANKINKQLGRQEKVIIKVNEFINDFSMSIDKQSDFQAVAYVSHGEIHVFSQFCKMHPNEQAFIIAHEVGHLVDEAHLHALVEAPVNDPHGLQPPHNRKQKTTLIVRVNSEGWKDRGQERNRYNHLKWSERPWEIRAQAYAIIMMSDIGLESFAKKSVRLSGKKHEDAVNSYLKTIDDKQSPQDRAASS